MLRKLTILFTAPFLSLQFKLPDTNINLLTMKKKTECQNAKFLKSRTCVFKQKKQNLIPPAVRYFFIIKTRTPQKTNSSHTVCNLFNT